MQIVYLRSKHAEGRFVAELCPTYLTNDFGDLVQIEAPGLIPGYTDAAVVQPVEKNAYWFTARNETSVYYS